MPKVVVDALKKLREYTGSYEYVFYNPETGGHITTIR